MSMILGLTTLSDANIARLLADPPLVWKVVAPDDPEMFETARAEQKKPSVLSRLFGRGGPSSSAPELSLATGEGKSVDLDKAWHGIQYLLTGTAWEGQPPCGFLVRGGAEVGEIDVGYGPARVLAAAETRAVRDALEAIDDDALKARFAPADMIAKQIYPEIWDREQAVDDTLGYLMENVKVLRRFLDETVAAGHGLLISLT